MSDSEQGRIYLFDVEETYLFKYYFAQSDIHRELQRYYNSDAYRYEIPKADDQSVIDYLNQHEYRVLRVNNIHEFVVVIQKQCPTDSLMRNAVVEWTGSEYEYFIMQSPGAITDAIEQGATRLENTDLSIEYKISENINK